MSLITLSKEKGSSGILQRKASTLLHYTIESSKYSDIGTYKCRGISTVFSKRQKKFGINVTCKLFLVCYFLNEKHNLKPLQ